MGAAWTAERNPRDTTEMVVRHDGCPRFCVGVLMWKLVGVVACPYCGEERGD